MKLVRFINTSLKSWYLDGEDAEKIVLHANVVAIKLREGSNRKVIAVIVYYKDTFYYVRLFKSNRKMYVTKEKSSSVFSWLDRIVDEKLYQEYKERELVDKI